MLDFLENTSLTSFSLIAVLSALVLGALYSFLLGKDKIVSILFASYVSYGFVSVFPYTAWTNYTEPGLTNFKFFLFLISVFVFSIIFIITHISRTEDKGFFIFRWLRGIVFAVSQIGLLISLSLSLIPIEWTYKIPGSIQQIFAGAVSSFIWFVTPIIIILLTKKRRHRGPGRPSLD